MNGLLIVNHYLNNNKFSELNNWIADSAANHNINLSIVTNREIMNFNSEKLKKETDFVLFWDKDIILAKKIEKMGFRIFNTPSAIEICDDKALTYIELLNSKIKMPKTIIAPMTYDTVGYTNNDFLDEVEIKLGYPMIVKERFGSFGEQVYLVVNKNELNAIFNEKWNKKLIFQEYISTSFGKDIRLNVVGNKVVASMYRYSTNGDFRANVTNGASMKLYTPTKKEEEMAINACKQLGLDFGGVDILFGNDGEPILCEVNSNAHFINIFRCTGINVADYIFEYITQVIHEKSYKASL